MLKEFRKPDKDSDRKHDDSFDLEETGDERGHRRGKAKPGKKSRAESLEEVLEILEDSSLAAEEREREAASFLLHRQESGEHLDSSLAAKYGERLGMDLGGVRVHTDAATTAITRALGVTAFTFGKDIFFSAGAYQPQSRRGKYVIAHEVAHVAQHRGRAPKSGADLAVGRAHDRHEKEADSAAAKLVTGARAKVNPARPGVRFMMAYGESDELPVAEGLAGLGASAEELELVQKQVDSASLTMLLVMMDTATPRQWEIMAYCITRSDRSEEDKHKALLRKHDNPSTEEKVEVHGVSEAQGSAEQAQRLTKSEKSDVGIQPDEAPSVQTVSARSAETSARGGPQAESKGQVEVPGHLSPSDEELIAKELTAHEIFAVLHHSAQSSAANMIADPDTLKDVGTIGAIRLLGKISGMGGVSQGLTGARALTAMINRDWEKTWARLSNFGEGTTEYQRLANNIGSVTEGVDLMLGLMRTIAGGLGVASSMMWMASLMTAGAATPIAATLSSVALGVSAGSGVLGMIRNGVLVPAEGSFRALDRYQKSADPTGPEQAADVLGEGADSLLAMLGGMSTTSSGGGPENASGSARAGAATQAEVSTSSPADLPLQDVSVQGYESSQGDTADVESDAAGIAVRDKSRDPEKTPTIAATEAADSMEGKGKPSATPDAVEKQDDPAQMTAQVESAAAVGPGGGSEHEAGDTGATSVAQAPSLEMDTGATEVARTSTQSPQVQAENNPAFERLQQYTGGEQEAPEVSSGAPQPTVAGRDNPPATLAHLSSLKQTLSFLIEARRNAATTKTTDISEDIKSLKVRSQELRQEVSKRQDVHRGQEERLGQVGALVGQFKSQSSRGTSAIETMSKISDVMQILGKVPGRLGKSIASRGNEIKRATKSWGFVCGQMGGQEQEVHAMTARQVTEARRLDRVGDRANEADAKLAQVTEALKSAQSAEQGGSSEIGALDAQIASYKETYSKVSTQLLAWARKNQATSGA